MSNKPKVAPQLCCHPGSLPATLQACSDSIFQLTLKTFAIQVFAQSKARHAASLARILSRALIAVVLFSTVATSLAQGLVNFMNTAATLISAGVPGNAAAITNSAGSYYFALLTAQVGITEPGQFTFSGIYATNSVGGRINGGNGIAVPGWAPGTAKAFMVLGWPASEGAAFNPGWLNGQVILPEFGLSSIGTGVAGGTDQTGQALPPCPIFGSGVGFYSPISVGFNIAWECLSCYPPRIVGQPQDQWGREGMSAQFEINAILAPFSKCQWYCNGAAINGATNLVLELTGLLVSQNGNQYFVTVSNSWGGATSSTATLNVSPAVRMVPGLRIAGQPGQPLKIIQSDVVGGSALWATWQAVVLDNADEWFFDTTAAPSQRFYGIAQSPGTGPAPTLQLHLVPTITLTGGIGSQIQVDYLQQSGATNTWAELATVSLTNASQFYFDTSGIGNPPRFYRFIPK